MKKYIPAEKLSKKARKELMSHRRVLWDIKPVTRRIENKKKTKDRRRQFADDGLFFLTLQEQKHKINIA